MSSVVRPRIVKISCKGRMFIVRVRDKTVSSDCSVLTLYNSSVVWVPTCDRYVTNISSSLSSSSSSFLPYTTVSVCVAPPTTSNLKSGRFWAILTASVNVRLWDSRSFRTVFIHVIRGRPASLFQSSGGSAVRIFFASALSSNRAMCTNRERCHAWIVEVRRGWPLVCRTSELETNWYHLMPNNLHRHMLWCNVGFQSKPYGTGIYF